MGIIFHWDNNYVSQDNFYYKGKECKRGNLGFFMKSLGEFQVWLDPGDQMKSPGIHLSL